MYTCASEVKEQREAEEEASKSDLDHLLNEGHKDVPIISALQRNEELSENSKGKGELDWAVSHRT